MEQNQPGGSGDSGESGKPERPPVEPGVPRAGADVPRGGPETGPGGEPVPPGAGAGGPGGAPVGPVKRRRSWKMVLLVVASVLGVLCSGTIGYGLWWYNQETKPDRSAPDVVVDNYLRALFVEENAIQRTQYSCSEDPDLSSIEALQSDIVDREEKFGADFQVTWGSLTESGAGLSRQVSVQIRLSAVVDGFPQGDIQTWQFDVIDQDEWRVCSSKRVG